MLYRQYRVYKNNEYVPSDMCNLMDQKSFTKARLYKIDTSRFALVHDLYSQILSTGILYMYLMPMFWELCGRAIRSWGLNADNELLRTGLFVSTGSLISTIADLPWDIYSTFVIEEKHGFNKQSGSFYAVDKIKKFIVMQLILVPVICGMIQIVKLGGDLFFIYLWLFMFITMILLMTIYPDYIAPLFDKFTPLPEGNLRTEIYKLASIINFPLSKLYVVDGSRRSAHSNAYIYGMFNNKRIVLFDTLVQSYNPDNEEEKEETDDQERIEEEKKGCNDEEVVAVICHELGHWKHNHVLRNFVIAQVHMLFCFVIFASLYRNASIYQAFGFERDMPILIGMLLIFEHIFSPYNFVMDFVMITLSRHHEFQADDFARRMHQASFLRSSLIKLNKDNLGFPLNDWLYSAWHHSHPPLPERVRALGKTE